jgi:uncharacterized membrane protein (DUF4010 family)
MSDPVLIGFAVALGAGLLIGIDRERHKGVGPTRAFAGVRTFTLAALTGALAQALAQPWLVAIGAVFMGVMAAIAHWRERSDDPGVTTELALFVTYLLGVSAQPFPGFTAGAAVIVALLLASRTRMHKVSVELISEAELRDGLLLAGAALVILPLMPNRGIDIVAGLNPRRLWSLVVLFMSLQAVGYVATRTLGARLGFPLSGLASGFISSTATIAAMGARARREPALHASCVAGALFSLVSTSLQLAVVAAVVYPPGLSILGPSILLSLLAALIAAAISFFQQRSVATNAIPSGRMFNLRHALMFAALLSGFTAAIGIATGYFGKSAVGYGAALAGFVDAHAAVTSVLALCAGKRLALHDMLLPALLGLSTNTLGRLVIAYITGGLAFFVRVGAGLVAVITLAWLPYFF